jgi:transcription elongation factor/antiterminator RfaH
MLSGGVAKSDSGWPAGVAAIDHYRPRWYVVHTRSRHEKRVSEQLEMKRVEAFLPLYRSKRNWNGRNAVVDLPLFPGYVFVRIPLEERLSVLGLAGVAGLVSFQGAPAALPDGEMEKLRVCLSMAQAEPVPYFQAGNRVRIVAGALAGLEGVILRQNGQARFVLSIDLILRSVAVSVDACDLELAEPVESVLNAECGELPVPGAA